MCVYFIATHVLPCLIWLLQHKQQMLLTSCLYLFSLSQKVYNTCKGCYICRCWSFIYFCYEPSNLQVVSVVQFYNGRLIFQRNILQIINIKMPINSVRISELSYLYYISMCFTLTATTRLLSLDHFSYCTFQVSSGACYMQKRYCNFKRNPLFISQDQFIFLN